VRADEKLSLRLLDGAAFYGLIIITILTAIPYGTVEPWSIAAFEIGTFFLGLLWIVHGFLSGSWRIPNLNLFYPLIALALYAFLQSLSWRQAEVAGTKIQSAISADPFESWLFGWRLSALTLAGILAARFTATTSRLRLLVHLLVLVAVLSAIFGIIRQATQHEPGFLLPYLNSGGGFGQFINRNHFAFTVEAAMGLLLGVSLLGRGRREELLVYLSAILLLWVALVMSRSRGGLLAVTVQAICAISLLIESRVRSRARGPISWKKSAAAVALIVLVTLGTTIAGVAWLGGDQLTTGVETANIEMGQVNLRHEGTRRSDIWRASWRMARAHPLFGAGLGGFWAELPAYHDASGSQTPQQAHNDYLELFASGGLIGAAILIWFVVILYGRARSIFREQTGFQRGAAMGAILGLVGIGVQSLVEFGLHVTLNALLLMILLSILSLDRIDQLPQAQAHRSGAFN